MTALARHDAQDGACPVRGGPWPIIRIRAVHPVNNDGLGAVRGDQPPGSPERAASAAIQLGQFGLDARVDRAEDVDGVAVAGRDAGEDFVRGPRAPGRTAASAGRAPWADPKRTAPASSSPHCQPGRSSTSGTPPPSPGGPSGFAHGARTASPTAAVSNTSRANGSVSVTTAHLRGQERQDHSRPGFPGHHHGAYRQPGSGPPNIPAPPAPLGTSAPTPRKAQTGLGRQGAYALSRAKTATGRS
jgi:hypothetical protein